MPESIRPTRRGAAVVLALLAALISTLLLAPTASAATCYGIACNYLDPDDTGCSADARTIRTDVIVTRDWDGTPNGPFNGEAYLVESPTCNTMWVVAWRPADNAGELLQAGIFASSCYTTDSGCNVRTSRSTSGTAVRSLMYSPQLALSFHPYCFGGWAEVSTLRLPTPAADMSVCS